MVFIAAQALGRRTPPRLSRWRRQGSSPRFPDCGVSLNAYYILQTELRKVSAKLRALPITRIRQDYSHGNLPLHRLPDLLQRNLRLGLKHYLFRDPSLSAAFGILAPHFRQV